MIFCVFFKSGLGYFTVQCASCICMCVGTDKKDKGVPLGRPCPGVPISKHHWQQS